MTSADVIVVGASFAGLACARSAAQRGLRVHVLESKPSVEARPSTTGILVREAAEILDLPVHQLGRKPLVRTIEGVRLYAPNLESIDLRAPDYYFQATDLPRLMRWMAERTASAGAQIRFSSTFRSGTVVPQGYRINDTGETARFLVGADGARSRVAAHFGLGRNERFLVGVEHEYRGIEGIDDGFLHVFIDRDIAPGYIAWLVPGVGVTQVGLAGTHPTKLDMPRLIRKLSGLFGFRHAERVATRGGLIPAGGPVTPRSRGNVILLGDAAGIVSPLTAGGIHKALQLGNLAGICIAEAIHHNRVDPARVLARQTPVYLWKKALRRIAGIQPPNGLIDLFFRSETFRLFAQLVFFHHRGLMSAQAWEDLTRLALERLAGR